MRPIPWKALAWRIITAASSRREPFFKYLKETQKTSLSNFTRLVPYVTGKYMMLDSSTRRNLELTETTAGKDRSAASLLWVLDKTKTAMGARILRNYLEQPLIDLEEIEKRQDAIEELNANVISREEIREYLNPVYDLERLSSRISYQSANPRDLIAFKTSLSMIPPIKYLLNGFQASADAGASREIWTSWRTSAASSTGRLWMIRPSGDQGRRHHQGRL